MTKRKQLLRNIAGFSFVGVLILVTIVPQIIFGLGVMEYYYWTAGTKRKDFMKDFLARIKNYYIVWWTDIRTNGF